jgi:hypothetical protein
MAFGKQSGPPASHHQLEALLELLRGAGHSDFRDARGPMGFTQRQAGGKFTRDEAQQFIDELEAAEDERLAQPPKPSTQPEAPEQAAPDRALRDIPSERLAAELRRRGWTVSE